MIEEDTDSGTASDETRAEHGAVSRRTLIGVGAGVVGLAVLTGAAGLAVENRLLPGRSLMHKVLGLNGPAGTVPNIPPGTMVSGSFTSKARLGADCGWAISYPPGSSPGEKLPVLIALHGYSDDHSNAFGTNHLGLDRFLAQAVKGGSRPFAIASVDGGNTYWHRRASGEDAGAMVAEEFVPLLAGHGLDITRFALYGWSMGGYGALHLASQLGPERVSSVAAVSPALWHTAGEAAHIAFDGAADFGANTPFGHESALAGIPIRIDCGTGDGFYPAVRDYVSGLAPHPAGGFTPGGHDAAYWRRLAPADLAFTAAHFS
ncbi:alpha/beta hydrolase [Diaminobutyricibacter sp. McL0608]|uniref:alpha/beta hydrolase n=1 Tax=Leifsonia sp. McL0608 TaxID=3143537 RepID=UPI0031F2D8E3